MNFYEMLGITSNATEEDIKKAYRDLAKLNHPDMHLLEEDKKKYAQIFKDICKAYEILSNPSEKSIYDLKYNRKSSQSKNKPKTKEDFKKEKDQKKRKNIRTKSEPLNINCSFFGGSNTGRNILVHLKLTPQEMSHGCSKIVEIKKRDFCLDCGGDGSGGRFDCKYCKNNIDFRNSCHYCDYKGWSFEQNCNICNGTGIGLWMIDQIPIKISNNVQVGHTINIIGHGENANGKPPGNVRVIIIAA